MASKEELDSGALKDKLDPADYNVQGLVSFLTHFLPIRLPAVNQRSNLACLALFGQFPALLSLYIKISLANRGLVCTR